mgnify:FL=1
MQSIESKLERRILKLSEAFEVSTNDPELELKVTILNINPKMNEDLKEKCPVLKQYIQYVEQVRCNSMNMSLEQAVEEAIEYCIRHDILREFLSKQKAEVIKMSIFEYDEEREIELIRRDEREIGERIGAEKERQNTERERENTIESIIIFGKKLGGSREQIRKELQERCALKEEEAEEKLKLYWKD